MSQQQSGTGSPPGVPPHIAQALRGTYKDTALDEAARRSTEQPRSNVQPFTALKG